MERTERISQTQVREISDRMCDPAAKLLSKVLRAKALVRQGLIREAAQLIERAPLPPITKERIAKLVSLHPPHDHDAHPIPLLAPPDSALGRLTPILSSEKLRELLRACDKGKATGPSNLTASHLLSLMQDQQCAAGLVALLQDVADGRLSSAAVDVISNATSVAIDKTNGADPDSSEVRPLAIPEILYKVAAMFLIDSIDIEHMFDLFPRIQLGCGRKNGVESALHRTQLALEAGGAGSDTVVLSLDFRNAFNTRKRHTIAAALKAAPSTSRLWRFFDTFYGQRASHLGIYDRGELIYRFVNDEGVRQGCPVASFLYALSVQSIYEAAVAGLPELEAVAVADDFTITGPAMQVALALQQLDRACKEKDGPELNYSKCRVLWAYGTNHSSYAPFQAVMDEFGIPVVFDSLPLLGFGVGLGMSRVKYCDVAVDSHSYFFDAINHPLMNIQCGMLLLRASGLPRFGYISRVAPPIIARAAAERFDTMIMRAVANKCRLPDPADPGADGVKVRRSITLPTRCTGMAFTPHTRSSPCAFWASLAASAPTMAEYRYTTSDTAAALALQRRLVGTDTEFHLFDTFRVLLASGLDPEAKSSKMKVPAVNKISECTKVRPKFRGQPGCHKVQMPGPY